LSVHTPCFGCAIAKSAVVHLPAFTLEADAQAAATLKERLQLAINALNTMGGVWPMAKMVKSQVTHYAREALTVPRTADTTLPDTIMKTVDMTAFEDDSWLDMLSQFDSETFSYLAATPMQIST